MSVKRFIFLPILISLKVYAQKGTSETTFEKSLIDTNIAISEWFDEMAEGIDLFIAGNRFSKKPNETNFVIENTTFVKEREEVTNTPNFNLNLRLHNTEEYWNLKFTSYDEAKEKRAVERGTLRSTARQRDYGAAIGLYQKLGKIRTAFQPRVSFTNSLKLSHSLKFESMAEFPRYTVNPKLELFGNPDDGTGILLAINLNFPLTKVYSLTLINDGEYISRTHVFSASNGFSIRQDLTPKTALSYSLIFDSNNQTSYHLEGYTLSVTWYHLLYKNILDYRIVPFVEFTQLKGFVGVPGMSFVTSLSF